MPILGGKFNYMRVEKFSDGSVQYRIRDIEGDMGETARMELLVEADGDVIVTMRNAKTLEELSMQFCTLSGGSRDPIIAMKLRELVRALAGDDPNPFAR